jgi:hypothetical protein
MSISAPKRYDPDRYVLDSGGQWWYLWGPRRDRTRTYVQSCPQCGEEFLPVPSHRKPKNGVGRCCSRTCGVRAAYARKTHPMGWRGENARHWTGGRRKTGTGYVAIYSPGHPSIKFGARKYVLEHRLVMEKSLGRYLQVHEHVHHRNGIKDDNRIENLELWASAHPHGQRPHEQQHCQTCTCHTKASE